MIKRSESKQKKSRRHRSERGAQKRRLRMEGLEKRQLLAVLTEPPTQPATDIEEYEFARNIGAVQAFTRYESEGLTELGKNDTRLKADFLPLGTGPGQQDTIDVSGVLPFELSPSGSSGFSGDLDTFSFDLRGGDILDIATLGGAGGFTVRTPSGGFLFGSDFSFGPNNGLTPFPVQDLGNATGTVIIPEDGRYSVTVSPLIGSTQGNYTLGLRVYRPTTEQLAIGDAQILYLDFAGDIIENNIFNQVVIGQNPGLPAGGQTRVRSLEDSLPILGLEFGDTAAANQIIDDVYSHTIRIFEDLARTGSNGDYEESGVPGEYGIRILNSRDHAGMVSLDDPRLTRLLIGGTGVDFGVAGVFGIAQSIDRGNFDLSELGIFALDAFAASAQAVQLSPRASQVDFIGKFMASVAAHEAGHTFGMWHTDNADSIGTLSDAGGTQNSIEYFQGIGNDQIFGTMDDIDPIFRKDYYQPSEGFFGLAHITENLSHVLSTGTVGGAITGNIFSDANRNGSDDGDLGISGVTVFADINENGVLDQGEPTAVTDASGNYSISVGAGSKTIIAIQPEDHVATTSTSVTTSIGRSANFGFHQIVPNITGTVYSDNNGDGFRDAGEEGIPGIFVFVDLDDDNRPDLGEASTFTAADGTYSFNFASPGTYTIRQVVEAGFELTAPTSGEHVVTFDGSSIGDNFDFGNQPSRDFGDAPDSYGTTLSANGASHGIVEGLRLGALVDREVDGQPDGSATGDDLDGSDDESGVRLLSPLGPGDTASFEVVATNTTGTTAYLQAFMDFNRDGDFTDAGEQFATNVSIPSGTTNGVIPLTVSVPADASVGATFARFRLSQRTNVGATGFAESGEVEDYSFPILNAAEIANDDVFTVSRNTLSNQLDVLANDFQTFDNQLLIDSINTNGTAGVVVRSVDQKTVFYTPPNGFIGRDVFSYTVVDQFGTRSTASVVVNVSFQSNIPIAIDDTFEVPQGSVNRALNVLDNDLASTFGGLTITSVTGGTEGGTLNIIGGGQSLRYTPLPGFNGTEQFTYSIQDALGTPSSATVTVNLLPDSRNDDQVDFQIGIFDPVNTSTELTNVQVGQDFLVRVTVEDIRLFASPEGVASAFLDLLYTDELVATLNTDDNPDFPFDISFGPLFSGINVFQGGDAQVPGLINEVGGVQRIDNQQTHTGPVELFTLTMRAVSPGVAVFTGDPADEAVSETTVLGSDVALTPAELRLGRTELLIAPASNNFTSAIDDSFPEGRDSDGNLITNASANRNRLNVLGNDNLGPTGTIREFGLVTEPSLGNVIIDDNGTPNNLNDDFFSYRANANANGLEQFTYLIVTDDNIRSTAEVTIALGSNNANADVALDFALVSGDGSGTPINSVDVGERFGVQIIGDDLRFNSTMVFAGFLDVLYDSGIVQPSDTNQGDDYDFDVLLGPGYTGVVGAGTAVRNGIIDEFGVAFDSVPNSPSNPNLLATLFFDAVGFGTTSIVGSPADSFPEHDTLLLNEDIPVDVSRIRYDSLEVTVGSGTPIQNSFLRQDVNNDGFVTTIDALLIVNRLGEFQASAEGELVPAKSQYFLDVTGDGKLSALDALQVINYLSRTVLEAEDVSGNDATDQAFASQGLLTDNSDDDDDDLDLIASDRARLV